MKEIPGTARGPALAWSAYPGAGERPPRLSDLEGRPVQWASWKIAPQVARIQLVCDRCGYDGRPWMSIGLVAPPTGATVTVLWQQPSERLCQQEEKAPAGSARRLFAYRCPVCGADEVYDMGEGGRDWRILL